MIQEYRLLLEEYSGLNKLAQGILQRHLLTISSDSNSEHKVENLRHGLRTLRRAVNTINFPEQNIFAEDIFTFQIRNGNDTITQTTGDLFSFYSKALKEDGQKLVDRRADAIPRENTKEWEKGIVDALELLSLARLNKTDYTLAMKTKGSKGTKLQTVLQQHQKINTSAENEKTQAVLGRHEKVGDLDFNSSWLELRIAHDDNGLPLPINQQAIGRHECCRICTTHHRHYSNSRSAGLRGTGIKLALALLNTLTRGTISPALNNKHHYN